MQFKALPISVVLTMNQDTLEGLLSVTNPETLHIKPCSSTWLLNLFQLSFFTFVVHFPCGLIVCFQQKAEALINQCKLFNLPSSK